jgi:hypothetical protein
MDTGALLYCNNNFNVKYRAIVCPKLSSLPTVPDYQGPDYQHLEFHSQKARIYLTVIAAYTSELNTEIYKCHRVLDPWYKFQ